jgi:diadenosine tetraphosphatase ApaH/serine/threonine PP2A family protein phosphatase
MAAQQGFAYSRRSLTPENIAWLKSLTYVHHEDNICFCHGSPVNAEDFEYVFSLDKAATLNDRYETLSDLTFVGHSHLTTAFLVTKRLALQVNSPRFQIRSGSKYVFNVGSVGQPRDRDSRACCVVYDTEDEAVTYLRVEYDVEAAAQKIVDADLPPAFAERLFQGV